MPDLLPEPGLGLAVDNAGHEAGGETSGCGNAPEPVILADRLLLQTLKLHALVTSETLETQQTKQGKGLVQPMPEGDDSIERCSAVFNPAIWYYPVLVGPR